MLGILGVSADGESVYRAMLGAPDRGVAELADDLHWAPERVRDALDELARLSLTRRSDQRPSGLLLVDPEVGLEQLLARRQSELAQRQHEITSSKVAIRELVAEYSDTVQVGRRLDVEQLDGVDVVRVKLEELAHNCTSEVLEFITGGGQSEANREASRPLDERLLERGVSMRSVYLESVVNHPRTVSYLEWLNDLGACVRLAPALPLRMIVFDREAAIIPTDPENTASGALLLHGGAFVTALCALFEQTWQEASPFGSTPQRHSSTGLTPQMRAVLSLLAGGHTDEVVARKLGISVRTSRRITAELMTALGARSRFQAGVIAGERGWLHGT
ncbi:erythropoiesis-stimulating protein [Streptomyces oceani]|uniref:Erythropoiesis-stimulating protein n=1 Tax=Streptomyces oceani TaxID=1075402 RepID=A0A1E7JVV9_9ACTN|nr:erythropoiesis-stimulating protein [Streptomyces oceani]